MVDDVRLSRHANLYVRVWRDGYLLGWVFGTRFPVERRTLVHEGETNLNYEDPRSIMDVLVRAVKFDRFHGKLHTLTQYSVDVWVPDEFGQPGAVPLRYNWRYTPDMQAHDEYGWGRGAA
jgi:hypothetical protein